MKQRHEPTPPRLAIKLFQLFCGNATVEDLRGDIDELFHINVRRKGKTRARIQYYFQVLSLITSYAVQKRKLKRRISTFHFLISPSMMGSYFKLAFRNMFRHRAYAIINVMGLALGITSCIVVYLIANYEMTFDTFEPDGPRIHRVTAQMEYRGEQFYAKTLPPAVISGISEVPGIEVVAAYYLFEAKIEVGTPEQRPKVFDSSIEGGYITTVLTSPAYFDIFRRSWLVGNQERALREPFSVVITESKARQYFGSLPLAEILDREIRYNDSLRVSVAGIIKDIANKTDFPFTDFISVATINASFLKNQFRQEGWEQGDGNAGVFVRLSPQTNPAEVNLIFKQWLPRNITSHIPAGVTYSMALQPLSGVHFTTDINREDGIRHLDGDSFRKANRQVVFGLMGVALFVLGIAIVNFINLSTAQSLKRVKEIGIRKIMGSARANLIFQYLIETSLQAIVATGVSIILVRPTMILFDSYIPEGVNFDFWSADTLEFIGLLVVGTSLLAGLYPASAVSSYSPVRSLRTSTGIAKRTEGSLRRALIVFQFTLSLVFIMGALVVTNQLRFMHKEFRFVEGTIISLWGGEHSKSQVLGEKVKTVRGVDRVAMQGLPPAGLSRAMMLVQNKIDGDMFGVSIKMGNEDFIPLYEMKIIAGRNLRPTDSLREVVVNKAYCTLAGVNNPEDIFQEYFIWDQKSYPIVGVVQDFHEGSFHEAIGPVAIANAPQSEGNLVVRLDTNVGKDIPLTVVMGDIETHWKAVYPDKPFQYTFLSDDIEGLFEKDRRTESLIQRAMLIAIFISSLGVLGLAMHSAQVRTKEIGIRKVLGATAASITSLLTKEIILLIVVSMVLASPVAWYVMEQWLKNFVYRTEVAWWIFPVSGLAAIGTALLAVSIHTLRASRANPAVSLRTE